MPGRDRKLSRISLLIQGKSILKERKRKEIYKGQGLALADPHSRGRAWHTAERSERKQRKTVLGIKSPNDWHSLSFLLLPLAPALYLMNPDFEFLNSLSILQTFLYKSPNSPSATKQGKAPKPSLLQTWTAPREMGQLYRWRWRAASY